MEYDRLSREVIGACIAVHRELGPGLLESVYETCVAIELGHRGLSFERQVTVPLLYRGNPTGVSFRLDLVVERALVLEVKAIDLTHDVHVAQLATYLRISQIPLGLLVNFNVPVLKQGIKRVVHRFPDGQLQRQRP